MTITASRPDFSRYAIQTSWLKQSPVSRTILIVYAHPDDESFGNAGTIARYSAEGASVHYACATRGECGSIDPKFLEGYSSPADLRTAELECAARTLGLSAVHYLNYRDSGMPGTPDNLDPRSFEQAPFETVVGQLVALIRALQPQIVITFNPYGGYGHPDHIKANRTTEAAFHQAGDPTCYPEQLVDGLTVWTPRRLYYSTFSTRFLKIAVKVAQLLRRDPRHFGENKDVDLLEALNQTSPITTEVDSRAYLAQKDQAWQCHQSQFSGPLTYLLKVPVAVRRYFGGKEAFTRAIPPWLAGERREYDLFEGL